MSSCLLLDIALDNNNSLAISRTGKMASISSILAQIMSLQSSDVSGAGKINRIIPHPSIIKRCLQPEDKFQDPLLHSF